MFLVVLLPIIAIFTDQFSSAMIARALSMRLPMSACLAKAGKVSHLAISGIQNTLTFL
jgi:hypothetical protein